MDFKKLLGILVESFVIVGILFGETLKERPTLTQEERKKLMEMIKEYYTTDSLRYYCYTHKWRERVGIKEKQDVVPYIFHLLVNAGAVYGRVEKVEGHPEDSVYHTWVYIKPYRTFKDIVTDSNGYVLAKEWLGPGPMGGTIAGAKLFTEGTDVLVFLDDIPWTGLGLKAPQPASPTMWKKAIKNNNLPLTSSNGYYELGHSFIIANDGKLQHLPRGYGSPWPRLDIGVVLEELEKAEGIWKEFIGK